jgi:regulator of sigma E protease
MITVLSTIFVLGVLIFIHELGHFIMAKRAGIKVEKFSLGFPPAILTKKVGETEYCIGLIPLGGFVKMAGENPNEEATGSPHEFMSKSIAVRAAVVFAGPFMNFLLACCILWGIFLYQGEPVADPDHAVIGYISPDGPAAKAGLKEGDIVTAINGTTVAGFHEMAKLISDQPAKEISITWQRDNQAMSATILTHSEEGYNDQGVKGSQGRIGVGQKVTYKSLNIFSAAWMGVSKAAEFVAMVFQFVYNLITMKISAKMVGGPVFIAQMAGQTAQAGFATLLYFMSLLSVNLAVLNVLPIPVLDGGHLVFLLIEKLKGSPLSMHQRVVAQQIGMVFLLVVIVLVTYNDIVRFVTG